jgi:hypothetical protein
VFSVAIVSYQFSDLHHHKLVGGVHRQQRRLWFDEPTVDR